MLVAVQVLHQASHRAATVTDAVLVLWRHLGKGAAISLDGLENAVVAKAARAMALGEDHTLDLALKHVHLIAL